MMDSQKELVKWEREPIIFQIHERVEENDESKKVVAVFMTAAMTMGMLAGCGSNNSNTGTANAGSTNAESKTDAGESADAAGTESTGNIDTADLAGTQITMLNSKGEIQTALEDMAEA